MGEDDARARFARSLLSLFLTEDEAFDVVQDLGELSEGRGRIGSVVYFWLELAKYPLRMAIEGLRGRRDRSENPTGGGRMTGFWKDALYAARSLVRSAGFSVTVITILALNLGATAAIYSVIKGVLLEPIPVEEPDRLMSVWLRGPEGDRRRMTPGHVRDLDVLGDVFASVAAFQSSAASLARQGDPVFLRGGAVGAAYFETLGVRPMLGRGFHPSDALPDAPPVVVLSHSLWQDGFGADPGILGRILQFDGISTEVVGVVPSGIFPTSVAVSGNLPFTSANQDYFVPLRFSPEFWGQHRSHVLGAIVRIRDGVDLGVASSALRTLSGRVAATLPGDESLDMNPFAEEVVGDVKFPLFTIFAAVAVVLLIGVVNVGALFVLRADDRSAEIDIRTAMGAPWSRVVRLLLMESASIAIVASVCAVAVAFAAIDLMRSLVPYQIPRLADVTLDVGGMAVTLGVGVLMALIFGVAPAWRISQLRSSPPGRWATASVHRRRRQGVVVAVQAGLGVVVLVGAMLLVRSFGALRSVDPGFVAREAWVIPLQGSDLPLDGLVDDIRALPGVAAASLTYDHPLQRNWIDAFQIRGVAPPADGQGSAASLRPFGEGYFSTVGIPLVEGRAPDPIDLAGDVRYAVVNEAFRDAYFPDGQAVGTVMDVPTAARIFGEDAGSYEILGVVRDVRFLGVASPAEPAFYLPLAHFDVGGRTLLVRPADTEIDVVGGVRRIVREEHPEVAIRSAQQLGGVLDDLLARPRFNMMLLVSFSFMGLMLCGLGVYGLVGRTVVTRLREIGIRIALGANSSSVARSIMGSALRPMAVGVALGTAVAVGLVRFLRSLLFEISPGDPLSFVASVSFMLTVGFLAASVPTLRALRIDPAETLRSE